MTKENFYNVILPIIVISVIVFGVFAYAHHVNKETKYCGIVNDMPQTDAGYKVHQENFVVFYNDSLKRNIVVQVTNNTYYNTKKGDTVCFNLTERNLEK